MIIVRTGILLPRKFSAMCIWPFILLRPKANVHDMQRIMRHEAIHGRQQLEMAWILFFIWYLIEFAVRFIVLRDRMKAYYSLSHEREAHFYENDNEYLKRRKPFAWIKFLRR